MKNVQNGLSWFIRYKLHNSYIYCLQLCKYNLKGDIQHKKMKKFGRKVAEFKYFIWELYHDTTKLNIFPDLTFCKKIYCKYVDVWLKIKKLNQVY